MRRCLRPVSRWSCILVLGVLLVGGLASARPVTAADANPPPAATTWEPALQIAGSLPAWFPDIALDPAGAVHMIWNTSEANVPTGASESDTVDESPNVHDYLMYGRFGTADSPPATDIGLAHGGEAIRNAILVDRTGTLDVLYRSSEHIWFIKSPIAAAPKASAWSEPVRLSGAGTAYYAAIAQSADGTLHVLYTENSPVDTGKPGATVLRQSLFYRRSADGGATWSAAIRLSSTETLRGTTRPQIRISGTTIVAAWDEGYDNINAKGDPAQGGIRRSLDGGRTWQPTQVITDPDGPIEQVTFAFGKENRALLVWRETNTTVVRYSTSNDAGVSWSAPAAVPNIIARPYLLKHQFDRYAIAADGAGVFHLLAVGQVGSPDQLALLHLELRDGVWSAPQSVYSGGGLPEYPGIATDGGNRIEVSFFVRDNLFQVGDYRVWRVSGRTGAPAVAPRPVPTVAPTPIPTVAAATRPAVAARATLPIGVIEPEQRASIDRPPGVVSYGGGLLAVMGLVGGAVALRLWWLRHY